MSDISSEAIGRFILEELHRVFGRLVVTGNSFETLEASRQIEWATIGERVRQEITKSEVDRSLNDLQRGSEFGAIIADELHFVLRDEGVTTFLQAETFFDSLYNHTPSGSREEFIAFLGLHFFRGKLGSA